MDTCDSTIFYIRVTCWVLLNFVFRYLLSVRTELVGTGLHEGLGYAVNGTWMPSSLSLRRLELIEIYFTQYCCRFLFSIESKGFARIIKNLESHWSVESVVCHLIWQSHWIVFVDKIICFCITDPNLRPNKCKQKIIYWFSLMMIEASRPKQNEKTIRHSFRNSAFKCILNNEQTEFTPINQFEIVTTPTIWFQCTKQQSIHGNFNGCDRLVCDWLPPHFPSLGSRLLASFTLFSIVYFYFASSPSRDIINGFENILMKIIEFLLRALDQRHISAALMRWTTDDCANCTFIFHFCLFVLSLKATRGNCIYYELSVLNFVSHAISFWDFCRPDNTIDSRARNYCTANLSHTRTHIDVHAHQLVKQQSNRKDTTSSIVYRFTSKLRARRLADKSAILAEHNKLFATNSKWRCH